MKCIENKEHEYDFIGFMVVADKMAKKRPNLSPALPMPAGTVAYSHIPIMDVPQHFEAKIEVHQCKNCGNIKLQPAVFSRILGGDKGR